MKNFRLETFPLESLHCTEETGEAAGVGEVSREISVECLCPTVEPLPVNTACGQQSLAVLVGAGHEVLLHLPRHHPRVGVQVAAGREREDVRAGEFAWR